MRHQVAPNFCRFSVEFQNVWNGFSRYCTRQPFNAMAVTVLNEDATHPSSNEARLLPEYGSRVQFRLVFDTGNA